MEKKFVKLLEKICGGLLVAMCLLLFAQVATRYILRGSLMWAGEMAVWVFVWISFLGSVVLFMNNKHIVVDIVSSLLPKKINDVLEKISSIIVVVFLAIMFYYSLPVVVSYSKQTATSIAVSKAFLFSSLTVSLGLMLLFAVYSFINKIRRR
jgi:TRAP-type C4-dicarboxylate transport system permease small subunit